MPVTVKTTSRVNDRATEIYNGSQMIKCLWVPGPKWHRSMNPIDLLWSIKELKSIELVDNDCVFINVTTIKSSPSFQHLPTGSSEDLSQETLAQTWDPTQPAYKQASAPEIYYTPFGQILLCIQSCLQSPLPQKQNTQCLPDHPKIIT